jgi:hypothetical protein
METPLKSYLQVSKKIETLHTNSASIDVHFHKFWESN